MGKVILLTTDYKHVMSESVEKQEESSEIKEVDPENVLHRDREKEKLEDKTWTSAILEDVKLYKSYEFRKAKRRSSTDKYHSIQTYTSDEDPKEVFSRVNDKDPEMFTKDEWKESSNFSSEGSFKYKGQKYQYRERLMPVAFVSRSPDTEYTKRIELSKISKPPVDIYESLSENVGHRVLVGRSMTGDTLFSTKTDDIEGDRVTFTKRSKIIGGGMLMSFGLSVFLVSSIAPILTFASLSLFSFITLAFLMFSSLYYGYKKTDYLYPAKDEDWLYKIPDEAAIQQVKTDGGVYDQFSIEQTEIHSYSDGKIVIEQDGTEWTFESRTDGTPNRHAVKLIDDVGIDKAGSTKEFAVAPKTKVIESGNVSYYTSDDGEKVLTTKSEYRDVL